MSAGTAARESVADFMDEASRRLLIPFAERVYPKYQVAPHIQMVATALEQVQRRERRFVAIMMPPRMSKSTTASELFPAWFLGNRPDDWIIQASHTAALAKRFSRRARRIVDSPRYPWPDIKPAPESRSAQEWDIAGHTGGLYATGVGGSVTGRGADCLIIDDAVRSAEDADSEVIRENTWEWFEQDAYSRLQPGGAIVLIGTRWHEDDLIGRALNLSGVDWHVLRFPAIAEEHDLLGRAPGEWLWPEWKSSAQWEETKLVTSPRNWNALYQQRPTSEEGAMFPRQAWQWYTPGGEPSMTEIVIACDSAFKEGVGADYSVFAVWGHDGLGSYYLLDLWRDRVEFPALIDAGHMLYAKWRGACSRVGLLVEDKASGQSAVQVWRKPGYAQYSPGRVATLRPALPVIPYKAPAGQSKVSRADGITHLLLAGRVYLPLNAPYIAEFVQEHVEFPLGTHDDQVDSTSIGLAWHLMKPARGVRSY